MYLPPVILLSVGLGILFLFEKDGNILLKLENIDELLLLVVVGLEVVEVDDDDDSNVGNELLLLFILVLIGVVGFLELLPNQLEKKDGFGSSIFFIIGIGAGIGKLITGFTGGI
jgi:hypothetical protein